MPLVSFTSGTVISSSSVNANFGICVLTDTSRTITVTHTYTSTQTFTGGWTAGAACTVSTGGLTVTAGGVTVTAGGLTVSASGITVTGNSTITGTLGGVTTLTATSFLGNLTGDVSCNTGILKCLAPAASESYVRYDLNGTTKAYIGVSGTVGGLTNGAAIGDLNIRAENGAINFGTVGQIKVLTLNTAGSFVFATAASKLVPGATSMSLRNNADSADNLLIADAGTVTLRGKMVLPGITPALDITAGGTINIGAVGVVGARATGYTNSWTGTPNRATAYDPSTVTLVQLAQRVKAIQDDLTVHGLIGV